METVAAASGLVATVIVMALLFKPLFGDWQCRFTIDDFRFPICSSVISVSSAAFVIDYLLLAIRFFGLGSE
jgi:hypothetical protein